jgi:hypothetical protein
MSGLWPIKEVEGGSFIRGRATGGTATTLVDTSKNLGSDVLKDKIIKVVVDGIEYVRKITANTADTITFGALVAKVAATAVIEKSGGGKVTITAVPEGSYANDYQVVVQEGEGASAETTAVFEDGVLTITLGTDTGTAASASIGTGDHGVVTITCKEVGDVDYSVIVSLSETPDFPLTATLFADGTMYITLGTDENGDPDATKNTAALIAALINGAPTTQDVFTAAASGDGSGVFSDAIAAVLFEGGVDPAIDATAADVVTEVDALDEFSAVANTPGVLAALDDPVQFAGGVDEVKPAERSEYYIAL